MQRSIPKNLVNVRWSEFRLITVATCICFSTVRVPAQSDLDAAQISPTLYFQSDADESLSRAALHAKVSAEVQVLDLDTVKPLLEHLRLVEGLLGALETHRAFFKVKTLNDTQDGVARKTRDEIAADQSVLKAAVDLQLRRLSTEQIDALGPYKYLAQMAHHDAEHALSSDAERYKANVVSPSLSSLANAYEQMQERLIRPKEADAADATVQRSALATWNNAYNAAAPEEATLLGAIVELQNRSAVAQGYKNAADLKYQARGWTDALVQQTLAAVQAEAPAYRHYQEVLAQHAATELSVSSAQAGEMAIASTHAPPISLSAARRLILDALSPLGPDYVKRFAALLNPANGRLDLAGGVHRAKTGTSIDAYNAPTALYYSGYDGSLKKVSTLAHEGGHAIHRELMNTAGIPVYERSGPSYLFEGYAIFNELLLLEHASEAAQTPVEKEIALECLLAKITLELFVSAEETTFERSLYLESSGQPLLDRARVDSLYRTSLQPYELSQSPDVNQSRGWMRKSLVFEDPLYLVNYLYASVIAVALYQKSHIDPDFATKYEALLRRGFDSEPQSILASIGIKLDDPNLVQPAAQLLTEKTAELQRLYAQHAQSPH